MARVTVTLARIWTVGSHVIPQTWPGPAPFPPCPEAMLWVSEGLGLESHDVLTQVGDALSCTRLSVDTEPTPPRSPKTGEWDRLSPEE